MATDLRIRIQDRRGIEAQVRPLSATGSLNEDIKWAGALETVNSDSSQIDAFGRQRISSPFTLFEHKNLVSKRSLYYSESLSGNASSTWSSAGPFVTLAVAAAGDAVVRQTRQRFPYQPGKSQLFYQTGLWTPEAGVAKRSGLWDGQDGIFYSMENASASWCVMHSGTITSADQASWNRDPLDGTGPTGAVLNHAGANLLYLDYEWLGVGRVRCGFVLSGAPVVVHEFHFGNAGLSGAYMANPNLPIRHQLSSLGSAGTLSEICVGVNSEGIQDITGSVREFDTGLLTSSFGTSNVPYGLMALRLGSAATTARIDLEDVTLACFGGDFVVWDLLFNPTVSGTLTFQAVASSVVEVALGNPAVWFTGGAELEGGALIPGKVEALDTHAFSTNIRPGAAVDGTRDIVGIAIRAQNAPLSAHCCLTWREVV